jgi:serine/threonine protein kinase
MSRCDATSPIASDLPDYHGFTLIGQGSSSSVFRAFHRMTHSPVAIKSRTKTPDPENASLIESSRREAQLLRRVDHPSLVRVFDFVETPYAVYLIMEYVSGSNLMTHELERGKFSDDDARHIIAQVVHGLDYLHNECHMVHRDLKLENIVLTGSYWPKIVDFGFSKEQTAKDQLFSTSCGSAEYAAPELFTREPYSTEIDVWSLGITLYAMLMGELPFRSGGNVMALIEQIVKDPVPNLSALRPEAADLITKMLAKDKSVRITIKEIIHHPWIAGISRPPDDFLPLTPRNPAEVHEDVCAAVAETFGVPPEECVSSLFSGESSKLVVAYRILLARKHNEVIARIGFDTDVKIPRGGSATLVPKIFDQAIKPAIPKPPSDVLVRRPVLAHVARTTATIPGARPVNRLRRGSPAPLPPLSSTSGKYRYA